VRAGFRPWVSDALCCGVLEVAGWRVACCAEQTHSASPESRAAIAAFAGVRMVLSVMQKLTSGEVTDVQGLARAKPSAAWSVIPRGASARRELQRCRSNRVLGEILLPIEAPAVKIAGPDMLAPLNHFALYVAGNNDFIPAFPVGIVACVVCYMRKRSEFGGWLLFFYWQLFSGAVLTVFLFSKNFQAYVPENFATHASGHHWFMITSVSTIVILTLQVTVGTMLIVVRSWDMLQFLRILLAVQTVAMIGAVIVDANYFPNYVAYRVGGLISECVWMAYFFMSDRVRHVFKCHDWETAVETIYPVPNELSIY
jgi:hypothetical protein